MAAHVRIKGTTYHFRRRVPVALRQCLGRSEIVVSLGTSSAREAAVRARATFVATERLFQTVSTTPSLAAEYVELILRRLRSEPTWNAPTREELLSSFQAGDFATLDRVLNLGADSILALPPDDRQRVLEHLERLLDGVEVDVAKTQVTAANLQAQVAQVRAATAERRARHAERRADAATGALAALTMPPASPPPRPSANALPPAAPVAATPAAEPPTVGVGTAPLFSAKMKEYFDDRCGNADMDGQTRSQSETTLRLWIDFHGDRPVGSYSRTDASAFRQALQRMPALHGKGGNRGQLSGSMRDIIARVDREDEERRRAWSKLPEADRPPEPDLIPRLTVKTVSRHFSALSAYHRWLCSNGHLPEDAPNPWLKHGFKKMKAGQRVRDERQMWTAKQLGALFRTPVWTGYDPNGLVNRSQPGRMVTRDARYWVPLLLTWSGMRLEEACQLRVADVIQDEETGIWYFKVTNEVRRLKSSAAIREVPVHSVLVRIGFLNFVAQQEQKKSRMLFPELKREGAAGKFGHGVSEWFTGYRRSVEMYEKGLDFHSMRGSVETYLENVANAKSAFVDALLGHESDQADGVGKQRYLKAVWLTNLRDTMEMLHYEGLDLSHLIPRAQEPEGGGSD